MFQKIKNREIIEFNKSLSLMLMSKLSILQAIEILYKQTSNVNFKQIISHILKDLKTGLSLSKSFSKHPQLFSEVYIANLKVAEETGKVAEVLSEYNSYMETMQDLRRKLQQASRYPLLVLTVSFAVVGFMVFFLIPTFENLFSSAMVTLPPLTKFIMDISYFVKDNIYFFLFISVFLIVAFNKIRSSEKFKEYFDFLIIKIPYISNLYKKNILARFSLSMSIALNSKVTLVEALKVSKNISSNTIFRSEMEILIKKLIKGESFSSNLSKSSFFDLTFSRLLTVGEESAELEKVFGLISKHYSKDFDYELENITSLVEPLLIIFIGIIVAIILVAMYLPMFELVNNFGI